MSNLNQVSINLTSLERYDMMDLHHWRAVRELNEHVNDCQICQQGTLCDRAEQIISEAEARLEQAKQEKLEQRLKDIRKGYKPL